MGATGRIAPIDVTDLPLKDIVDRNAGGDGRAVRSVRATSAGDGNPVLSYDDGAVIARNGAAGRADRTGHCNRPCRSKIGKAIGNGLVFTG